MKARLFVLALLSLVTIFMVHVKESFATSSDNDTPTQVEEEIDSIDENSESTDQATDVDEVPEKNIIMDFLYELPAKKDELIDRFNQMLDNLGDDLPLPVSSVKTDKPNELADASNEIVVINISEYGKSGNGRPLKVVSIVPASAKSRILVVFEIHGFEDGYSRDGQVLVNIAGSIIKYFSANPDKVGNKAIYIVASANPDGLADGWTNKGAGRCQVSGGIDINRDFNYCWSKLSNPRNKTLAPFSAPESRALRDLVISIRPSDVIDVHGWLGKTYGDASLVWHFNKALGIKRDSSIIGMPGYFVGWAWNIGHAKRCALVELPSPKTKPERVINAFVSLCAEK